MTLVEADAFDPWMIFSIKSPDKDFFYELHEEDGTKHNFPLQSCRIQQKTKDRSFLKFDTNVLTASAMQELIILRKRVRDLEEYKIKTSLVITKLEEKMDKMYYAPGMPGFIAAKNNYDKSAKCNEDDDE